MKALIDSDIYRYQFGSVEMKHPFLEGEMIPASSDYIKQLVDGSIKEVLEATGADEYVCALSGHGNFRNEIATQQPYKGNRDPQQTRPFHYKTIEDYIIAHHPHVVVDGIEADDWLGIEQRKDPGNTCIASRDKDLKTVHGWHYRFACGKAQPAVPMHWMTEEESMHFFFYQMLIGDNTDNIPGCGKKELVMWGGKEQLRRKGIGSKGALKILDGLTTAQQMYDAIKPEYEKVYGESHEEVMLEMARLLYIGQEVDNLFTWDWLGICNEKEENTIVYSVDSEKADDIQIEENVNDCN